MKIRAMCVASLFVLGACGGGGGSGGGTTGTGTVVPANAPPVAEAGSDVSSGDNAVVSLSGSASDSDGQISSTAWSQVSGPTATISAADTLNASIAIGDLSADADLVFRLTVSDNDGASSSDQVTVRVSNTTTKVLAALGPLSEASVDISAVRAPDDIRVSASTSSDGTFILSNEAISDLEALYLVSVSGGVDTDPDDDGVDDGSRIDHAGTFRGYLTGDQLVTVGASISVLSDIAWIFASSQSDVLSDADIIDRLNDIATVLIQDDVNGDGLIDHSDVSSFVPSLDQEKLNFDYSALLSPYPDAGSRSIIDAYHLGLDDERQEKIAGIFGTRISRTFTVDSRSTSVSVRLAVFGSGKIESSDKVLSYDAANGGYTSSIAIYEESDQTVTFTATAGTGREIHSWKGCDSVSTDSTQCTISLDRNRTVQPRFAYAEARTIQQFVDLSMAATSVSDSTVSLLIGHNDSDLVDTVSEIQPGWIISGGANGGFLRRVNSVTRISDFRYSFETSFAAIEDVVEQGTLIVDKQITFDDILQAAVQKQGVESAKSFLINPDADSPADLSGYLVPTDLEGVSIARPPGSDPNSFTVVFGKAQAGQLCDRLQSDPDADYTGRFRQQSDVTLEGDNNADLATISGCVTVVVSIELDADWGIRDLEYLRFVSSVQIGGGADLDVGLNFSSENVSEDKKRVQIAQIPLGPYIFQVGLLPVYVSPLLNLYLGADGKITGGLETGFEVSSTLREGFVYDSEFGTQRISETPKGLKSISFDFTEPTLTAEAELELNLQTDVVVRLYEIPTFTFPLKGYTRVKAEKSGEILDGEFWKNASCRATEWNLWGGFLASFKFDPLDGSLDGKSILGKFISDKIRFSFDIYAKEWSLATGTINGSCPVTRAKLSVVGTDLLGVSEVGRSDIFNRSYQLSNNGEQDLDWRLSYREGGPLSVDNVSGTLAPGANTSVTVTLDTSLLGPGVYENELSFRNLGAFANESDSESGNTIRLVRMEMSPRTLPQPNLLTALLTSPNVVALNWETDLTAENSENVEGYIIEQSTSAQSGGEWTIVARLEGRESRSYSVGDLTTGANYAFRVKSVGDRAESVPRITTIFIPAILPEENCQGFFSGLMVGDRQEPNWISEINILDRYSEYVGAGVYRLNSLAFPNAVSTTFDGIAIDAGTRVIIYSEPELGGEILYDRIGPAVVNNQIWREQEPYASFITGNWKEPLQSIFPQAVREWSASNMHPWSGGSLIVDCGYD